MPMIDFAEVRWMFGCVDVLVAEGWPLRREWATYRGPCPFHGSSSSRSRSLSVSRDFFRCWKCEAKGDVIRLYAKLHRLNDHEAATKLCEKFGRPIPYLLST